MLVEVVDGNGNTNKIEGVFQFPWPGGMCSAQLFANSIRREVCLLDASATAQWCMGTSGGHFVIKVGGRTLDDPNSRQHIMGIAQELVRV